MPKKSTSSGPHVNMTTSVAIYGSHYAQKLSIMVPIMAETFSLTVSITVFYYGNKDVFWFLLSCLIF